MCTPRTSNLLNLKTQVQLLTSMNTVVIKDYYLHLKDFLKYKCEL